MPRPCQPTKWIRAAKLHGFGGECGLVALAINRVVFGGRGEIVVATNWHITLEWDRPFIGHVGVRLPDGDLYDATGLVDYEAFRAFGMVDHMDPDFNFLTEAQALDAAVDSAYAFNHWGVPERVVTAYANVPSCATTASAERALQRAGRRCR